MGKLQNIYKYLSLYITETKLTLNIPKIYREIKAVLDEEPLWKDMPRKSYVVRLFENILWYLRNKEACTYYNSNGFDIKHFRNKSEYMPYRQFRIERFLEDYPKSLYNNKLCILRDKILFSAYFGDVLGKKYVIETKGKIESNGDFYNFETKSKESFDMFLSKRTKDTFIKKLNGENGDGVYLIKAGDFFSSYLEKIKGSEYIVQDKVEQNKYLNEINPSCLNTIRIVTIIGRRSKKPNIFGQLIRIGCNAINDNISTGGVGLGIKKDDGLTVKYAVGHHKVEIQHSITKKYYENNKIPYWNEVKELVLKAHSFLPEVPTIGWDVAITPNGPILLEGNDNWEISVIQDSNGGLKAKWYELHDK